MVKKTVESICLKNRFHFEEIFIDSEPYNQTDTNASCTKNSMQPTKCIITVQKNIKHLSVLLQYHYIGIMYTIIFKAVLSVNTK